MPTAKPNDSQKEEPADNAGSSFYINNLHVKKHRGKIRKPLSMKFIQRQSCNILSTLLSYHMDSWFVKRYFASLYKADKERVGEDDKRK